MAAYPLVSGKQVLARVIRALGYKLPSTYHDDILEWIPEGMGMLQVTNNLLLVETGAINCPGELYVSNYCVDLPCGFVQMAGVYDENDNKFYPGNYVTSQALAQSTLETARSSIFELNPFVHQTQDGLPSDQAADIGTSVPFTGSDLEVRNIPPDTDRFYIIKGNKIQLSMPEGYIKVRYYSIPICSDGYPLIPDNENFKSALEWHVIRRLLGSGLEHKIFTYDFSDAQFEKYAARGISEITYPTPDKMAMTSRTLTRLIPPDSFVEDYFINP